MAGGRDSTRASSRQGRSNDGWIRRRVVAIPADYAAGFFYDNLVYDPGYLAYLANVFAPGQVFCGTDYPYAIMETDPAGFVANAVLDNPESVRFGAAQRFLGLDP